MLNFIVIANIVIFSCKYCSGAITKLAESTGNLSFSILNKSIPYGKPIASLITVIGKPFMFLGSFYKIIIVIDLVFLIIWILSHLRRKIKLKSAIHEHNTQGTCGEMNIFK